MNKGPRFPQSKPIGCVKFSMKEFDLKLEFSTDRKPLLISHANEQGKWENLEDVQNAVNYLTQFLKAARSASQRGVTMVTES